MQIEISSRGYFLNIAEFKFIKDIGVGSFGKVKLAVHRGTRRHYAIKIIDLNSNLSQTEVQIILREIKIHLKLEHPHIIKLWDTLLEDNKIYMIMDYAKNGSLFRFHSGLLQCGSEPSPTQVYQFFYQTLQAIKYLHTNDLMHRDIKPENLLLDEDFNIKLCDFGWATNQITSSRTTFCGTYQYMAPEMVLQKSYDYRIDIWALGVLLFELVHGKAPFQAESLKIMKQKINKGSYQIDSSCQLNLKELIVDILQFMPQKRLSIDEIQKHAWVKLNMGMAIGDEVVLGSPSNSKSVKSGVVRKHHYQKSLGNFQSEAYKNYFNDTFQDQPKHKINLFDFQASSNLHLGNNKTQIKKHKRNVTQPDTNEFFQRHENQNEPVGLGKKIMHMNFGLPQTDTNTPAVFDSGYLLLDRQKQKMKCKTQADKELSKLDTQTIGSKKNMTENQDFGLKKKKTNLFTETGQSLGGHTRNYSNGQIKQNDPYCSEQRQKTKKKHKLQEKPSSKIKKMQDRFLEITNKLNHEKTKQYEKLYLS